MADHKLKERTYLNADRTKAVNGDSPDAAYLLGGEGDEIPEAEAKRLGLGPKDDTSSKKKE
jgi:hypothetical protein